VRQAVERQAQQGEAIDPRIDQLVPSWVTSRSSSALAEQERALLKRVRSVRLEP
jgi:hypothetical protein